MHFPRLHYPARATRAAGLALGIVACAVLAAMWWSQSGSLPGPQVESASRPDSRTCAQCHEREHASFQTAPHARTLQPLADSPVLRQFTDQRFRDSASGAELTWQIQDGVLQSQIVGQPRSMPLQWAFGSGRHAVTPVGVWQNTQGQSELLEHRVSWYPPGELHATLGLDGDVHANLEKFGRWHGPEEAARCFGCHSTRVPRHSGRIQFDRLLPNIHCDRCHQGSTAHAAGMLSGQTRQNLVHWPLLTSRESIHRCGECHRRAEEFTSQELQPQSVRLVRFAPVGLSQSPCFQPGAQLPSNHADSLTCIRCHDPHRPAESEPEYYRLRCLECHDPQEKRRKPCAAQPATSQCIDCHMPKIALNPWLSFTDHWIRVRDQAVDRSR